MAQNTNRTRFAASAKLILLREAAAKAGVEVGRVRVDGRTRYVVRPRFDRGAFRPASFERLESVEAFVAARAA